MAGYEGFCSGFGLWWIIPLLMIALCFFMMRGRRGPRFCGMGSWGKDSQHLNASDSGMEILNKRYALGEISREEYEEKKRALSQGT